MEIDKELIARRFGASFESYDRLAHVQRQICERLFARLCDVAGDVGCGLEIGAGTGFLTRRLMRRWPDAQWFVNDLSPASRTHISQLLAARPELREFICGDAECVAYPAGLELIASASTVQWFADPAAFAHKAAAALKAGGHVALSSFGPDNFHEIRSLTNRGLDYPSLDELAEYFRRASFEITHAEQWTETLLFDTPNDVLRYIKSLGLNALGGVTNLRNFTSDYPHTDGRAPLTYHPLLIVAEKS